MIIVIKDYGLSYWATMNCRYQKFYFVSLSTEILYMFWRKHVIFRLRKAYQRVSSLIWVLPVVWWIYWGALYWLYCLVLRSVIIVPDKSINVLLRPWTSFVLGLWRVSKFVRKWTIKTKIFIDCSINFSK